MSPLRGCGGPSFGLNSLQTINSLEHACARRSPRDTHGDQSVAPPGLYLKCEQWPPSAHGLCEGSRSSAVGGKVPGHEAAFGPCAGNRSSVALPPEDALRRRQPTLRLRIAELSVSPRSLASCCGCLVHAVLGTTAAKVSDPMRVPSWGAFSRSTCCLYPAYDLESESVACLVVFRLGSS